jgi:glutamyl-tRNA reductase
MIYAILWTRICVDDLRDIVDQNLRGRQTEARKADLIIAEGVRSHREAERSLAAVDTVKEYRLQAQKTRDQELQRALRLLSRGEEPTQVLTQLARGITQKLIHAPSTGLKKISAAGREDLMLNARKLLGLAASPETVCKEGQDESGSHPEKENIESGQNALSPEPIDPSEQTLQ